eukprot:TRINITY_DN10028_c0_g1_i12.p1 TRINITY_DN10028_c0_g1~~TRINITY_DN10028_c0_g1_i12.p1  ORF type:complete len:250 (-),score=67.59 TRINITY_DN10028_c0_g1_i12:96-740(-)
MSLDDIDSLPILDKEMAINQLDDAELFETMLSGFEEMSMRSNLTDIKIAIEKADYGNVRLSSHSLKGASSYIHAERVKTVASLIQTAVDSNNCALVAKYYPELVKQCILLKRMIRREACSKDGKVFEDDDSDFDVPIAKNFKVVKRSNNDFEVAQIGEMEVPADNKETLLEKGETSATQKIKEAQDKYDDGMDIKTNEEPKSACCTCIILCIIN